MVASKKTKETPAEQLLRMIEGPQSAAGVPKPTLASSIRRLVGFLQALPARMWRRRVPARRETDPFLWNLRMAQRALWVVLIGLGAYVAIDLALVQPKHRFAQVPAPGSEDTAASVASPSTPLSSLKPLAEYLAAVQQRNPFGGAAGLVTTPDVKTTKRRLEELAQGLVVVGIDRSANPEAIVEDTVQKRTYFVKVGDEINGMVVKEISPKGVIVSYEGEEQFLR